MKKATLIFPNQIFEDHPALNNNNLFIIIEHDIYFKDFKYHKQKLVLHRASLKFYQKYLEDLGFKVKYIESEKSKDLFKILKDLNINQVDFTKLIDKKLDINIKKSCEKNNIKFLEHETPYFITPSDWLDDWYKKQLKTNKKLYFTRFYSDQRKRTGILMLDGKPLGGKLTYGKENRQKLPQNIKLPKEYIFNNNKNIKEAINYINTNFQDNPGSIDNFNYATNFKDAKEALHDFLKNRLENFGKYQDSIQDTETNLFHSILSPYLNIGLLTPEFVIKETLGFSKKHNTPLNSLEGFIRQIVGWREYMYLVYKFIGQEEEKLNFFNHKKRLPQKFWYAKTEILPLDKIIEKVEKTAYCHHIERLMVLGNFMLLCEIAPKESYDWFMQMFIDAYDWVMVPNVYGMSQYSDGGKIVTKPYVSGSNYIKKMSNYKSGKWCDIWDGLFWRFIKKHSKVFSKIGRLSAITQNNILKNIKTKEKIDLAENYLKNLK